MANMTPMMRQYLEMKDKYPGMILFFRLGDFYEMFFDDAAAWRNARPCAVCPFTARKHTSTG